MRSNNNSELHRDGKWNSLVCVSLVSEEEGSQNSKKA